MRATRLAMIIVFGLYWLGLAGCTEVRDETETPVDPTGACLGCHGDESGPAPTDPLHVTHLTDSERFLAVTCESCHIVPETVNEPGHLDDPEPAEVTFSGAAISVDADVTSDPSYAADTRSCSTVACHGAGLDGGMVPSPVWDEGVSGQAECDSCHGNPPGGEHPANDKCSLCHVTDDITVHNNGKIDAVLPEECNACHGDELSPAPIDLVHRTHVLGSGNAKAVACSNCHVVPEKTGDEGHIDEAPAEVVFSGKATANDAKPTYEAGTCSNTYCHADRPGGALTAPSWTDESGAPSACGSCHGNPMPPTHPQVAECVFCHAEVVSADGIIAPDLHVNGEIELEVPKECGACHGEGDAPEPKDGGHDTHLGTTITELACASCHLVPTNVFDPGHVDSALPVEVTFQFPATANDAEPTWDSPTCAGTACHMGKSVEWSEDIAGPAACDACHGAPPAPPHSTDNRCEACHDKVSGPDLTVKNSLLHIDGKITVNDTPECTTCHGLPPAPPHAVSDQCDACHSEVAGPDATLLADTLLHANGTVNFDEAPACNACHGSADTPAPDLGAHLTHIDLGLDCSECHVKPATAYDEGHVDSDAPAEVTFGPLATTQSSKPVWDADSTTCSSVWCHGGGSMGGSHMTPDWFDTSGTPKNCGACHSLPPAAPHVDNSSCATCHVMTYGTPDHANGTIDFDFGG